MHNSKIDNNQHIAQPHEMNILCILVLLGEWTIELHAGTSLSKCIWKMIPLGHDKRSLSSLCVDNYLWSCAADFELFY